MVVARWLVRPASAVREGHAGRWRGLRGPPRRFRRRHPPPVGPRPGTQAPRPTAAPSGATVGASPLTPPAGHRPAARDALASGPARRRRRPLDPGRRTHVESPLPVLGWKEHVSLPDWGIERLRAKLDTGARTAALHVQDYSELAPEDGRSGALPLVTFHVLVGPRSEPRRVEVVAPVVGHRLVRDTRARPEHRPIVRTRIVCGPIDVVAEVSLTDRSGMNFRMLLGRLTLAGSALVDPARGYRVTTPPPARGARSEP
ncbi:hypothetical protein FTX61_15515 [Nitriliruptoraceae bacterium ZYF776]|nr:hypothetical protein [Profundirhabdus halotolerans]